jgi:hypothetical protein
MEPAPLSVADARAFPASTIRSGGSALLCPSAQPEIAGSTVLGVVAGTPDLPDVAYLDVSLPVTQELLNRAASVKPTEVFRFAAHCEEGACRHFSGGHCALVTRIVQILPVATDALPRCVIRPTCRWYRQQGREACLRCPQIVTYTINPTEEFRRAAEGQT